MLFNFGKCKCIHIGHGNMDEEYKMGDTVLGRTTQEKDLRVTFSADMKVSEQCGIAASKGNQILGLIRRTITYKEKQLIVPLYKAIVRSHLEYCIEAWRPYRKKDIDKLERIQRRATEMIPELRDLSYESRLLQCGLTTLQTRRLRGDQIKVFKIVNGYLTRFNKICHPSQRPRWQVDKEAIGLSRVQQCSSNLGLIRRNITYKEQKLIIPLYKAIVRPHLEYCIQAWRPYRKKDIDTLERIQRRATKMIPELRDLSYEERLKECGLTTLETRRLRGDQIEVFKILNGYENIDRNMFFSLKKDSRTRGHEVKLVKDQCRLDIRKHSFSQRTINEWNKLSTDCVTASSVNVFKVDTYLRRAGYK